MTALFGRRASLIVSDGSSGLDLSDMHFRFEVKQSDVSTPNKAFIRVYNLAPSTVAQIESEYTQIMLEAGYENSSIYGQIFRGTITQFFKGRERNIDSYLDIYAADGDSFTGYATVNTSVVAGSTPTQNAGKIFQQSQIDGKPSSSSYPLAADVNGLLGGVQPAQLSRGKVLYGMARDYARDWAQKNGFRWSIQNGQVVIVPIAGYRPGEAVVIDSTTGMIGVPEATNDGVHVRSLLNPLIRIGCLVQVQQADINSGLISNQQLAALTNGGLTSYATTTTSKNGYGTYRVMVSEFTGDTRGQPWYVDMTCLAVDVSAPPESSVQVQG